MIKDKLRKDLISFIGSIFGYTPDLESMSYNELFCRYIDLLGIPANEFFDELAKEVESYHEQYPDYYIEEEQVINDIGLLQPISMAYFIDRQIVNKKLEIMDKEAEIIYQKKQLEEDEKALKDPSVNWAYKVELPQDMSQERYIINTYPGLIENLKKEIEAKEQLLAKIYSIYKTRDGEQLLQR